MRWLLRELRDSPLLARVVPFLVLAVLTAGQGLVGEASRYWLYLAKMAAGAWLIWVIRPCVREMRWKMSWEAIVVGIAVFGLWVGLDGSYPRIGRSGKAWNPHDYFGVDSPWAWVFVWFRVAGSSLVVPPLEEIFYRSFLYRYIADVEFQNVALESFSVAPFVAASAVFSLAHFEWLPALLCGLAYQGLVIRKKRLGDAITAHAVTNFLLGLWVVWKGAWQFW